MEPEVVAKQKSPTLDRYQGMESTNFENFINQNNNEFESTYNSVDYNNDDNNKKNRNNNFRKNQQPTSQRRTRWDTGAPSDPQPSTSSNNINSNNLSRGVKNLNANVSVNNYSGYNGLNCVGGISNPKLQPINGNLPPVRKVYDPQVDGDCSVTEVKLQFKHLCHCQLKYGNCGRLRAGNCQYNHTVSFLIFFYN